MPPTKRHKILNRPCREKNAQRKVRFKIYDHSDPNTPVASDISVIDEEADEMDTLIPEREEGKNKLLSTSLTLSPIKSALANFTAAEKEKHFNFCMKLSLQNKITTKNAFSLHLIEVFSDNVKQGGEPNFQMASLTLDASARIYGFRVDCLHAETLKMAASLHSERMRKDDEDGNGENKIDDGDLDEDRRAAIMQRKKKKRKKRFLAPSAAKSLQLVHLETENEPHENFHAIKSMFNEVECGSSLNSCSVVSDDLKIPFTEAYPYLPPKKKFSVSENSDRTTMKTAMRMLLPLLNSKVGLNNDGGIPVAPSLESFSFLKQKWLHENSFSDLPLSETLDMSEDDEASSPSPSVSPTKIIVSPDNTEFARFLTGECFDSIDKGVLTDPELCSVFNVNNSLLKEDEAGCEDINNDSLPSSPCAEVFLVPKTHPPPRSSLVFPNLVQPGSTLKSFENSYMHPPLPHPPGTFETVIKPLFEVGIDPIVNAALTGRCQGRTKKVQHLSKREAGPIKRKPRSRFLTFEKDSEIVQKKVRQGKRNKHTDNYVNKWLPSDTLLPPVSFDSSDFRKTFIIPLGEVLEWEESLCDSDDGNDAEVIDNTELNRSIGYDHISVTTDDECKNHDQPYKAEDLGHLDIISEFDDLYLVPKPEMVKREIIHYAKHSKNVDQKRVKATIWNVITNHYVKIERSVLSEQDQNVQSEEQFKRMTVTEHRPLKFSEMYGRLVEALPSRMKSQMSVHIAFVSLLHLANEKNLDLTQKPNESDFSVLLQPSTNFN